MFKSIIPVIASLAIGVMGCSSNDAQRQDVPDISQSALYNTALAAMASNDYGTARKYLEALDSRYPFGELTDQVQLDLIYVYYKSRESDLTSATINRYLRLNPGSMYADYVLYMRGLNNIQKHSDMIQEFLRLDRAEKDPTYYYEAFKNFNDLIKTYPQSPYVKDARQRMIFIKDQLAEREWHIEKYYDERGSWLSAIRHCQSILYSYRDTQYIGDALKLMEDCYRKLGLDIPADNTAKVIAASGI